MSIRKEEEMSNAAKKLVEARKSLNKTQLDVSKELGIPQSTLGNYEQGTRTPRDEMKMRLARYYNTSVESLFFSS